MKEIVKNFNKQPLRFSLGTKKVGKLFPEIQLQVVSWEHEIKALKALQRLQPLHCYVRAQHSRSKKGNSTSSTKTTGVKSKEEYFIQINPVYRS